jgi:hypothetical protein
MDRAARLLVLLFFFGLALTLLAFIDLQWTHRMLVKSAAAASSPVGRR